MTARSMDGLEVELELRQALVERVVGEAEPPRQPAGAGRLDLGREQALEDLDRGRRLGARPLELRCEVLRRRREAEVGEVLAGAGVRGRDPGLGGAAHRASSAYTASGRTSTVSPAAAGILRALAGVGRGTRVSAPSIRATRRPLTGSRSGRSAAHASPMTRPVVRCRRLAWTSSRPGPRLRVVPGERRVLREHLSGEPGEEVLLDLADHALDLALGLGPVRPAGPRARARAARRCRATRARRSGPRRRGSRPSAPCPGRAGSRPSPRRGRRRSGRCCAGWSGASCRSRTAPRPCASSRGSRRRRTGPPSPRPAARCRRPPSRPGSARRGPSRSAGRARPRSPGAGRPPAGAGSRTTRCTRTRQRARAGARSPAGRGTRSGVVRRGRAGRPTTRPVSPSGGIPGARTRSRTSSRYAS